MVASPTKLSIADADSWFPVAGQDIHVSDLIDQSSRPDAEMTVGFARIGAGETLEISFPYDEVLIVTKGRYTVTTGEGATLTAGPGEVIYLPGGSENDSRAEEATEMVYVAAPPSVYAAHVAAAGQEDEGAGD
jgi:ethanolamine utilization protein EutQ (cupin superfamily)